MAASGAEVAAAHSPLLFLAASPSALLIVAPHLRRAVPAVLDALTLTLTDSPGTHDAVSSSQNQHAVSVLRNRCAESGAGHIPDIYACLLADGSSCHALNRLLATVQHSKAGVAPTN